MFKINTVGIDGLVRDLEKKVRTAANLEETTAVSFEELFNPAFLSEHTHFASFAEFLEHGGFAVESQSDFDAIPDDDLDKHVRLHSSFASWQEMLDKAATTYVGARLLD
jgi:hypothetical protein